VSVEVSDPAHLQTRPEPRRLVEPQKICLAAPRFDLRYSRGRQLFLPLGLIHLADQPLFARQILDLANDRAIPSLGRLICRSSD